ncbi:MAG: hypothetical protein IJ604_08795 [Prevotella sp.]|nr:hypothetical protein [Prevotella sp.]
MKLRDYICLVSGILLVGCIVGMALTFKIDNALCARFFLWSWVFCTAFCLSGFRMNYDGKR